MTPLTLTGADIRGYYEPARDPPPRRRRASKPSVRCFADPGSHRREDRDPSCSINVINGAWQCHGCGARGGAYDAALAKSHTPRSAIDLMIAHGLIERRAQVRTARELLHTGRRPAAQHARAGARLDALEETTVRPSLHVTEQDIARWQAALARRPCLLAQLAEARAWSFRTMRALGLGLDRGRVTIPIRQRSRRAPWRAALPARAHWPAEDARHARDSPRARPPPRHRTLETNPPRRRPTRHDRRTDLAA